MVWLTATQIAEKLSVGKRTAMALMQEMPHSVIGGTERKRIRVSQDAFESWMLKRNEGKPPVVVNFTGSNKKLKRR